MFDFMSLSRTERFASNRRAVLTMELLLAFLVFNLMTVLNSALVL